MAVELPEALSKFTVQDIQFELLRRASGTGFKAEKIIALLQEHKPLWNAACMDRIFAFAHSTTRLLYLPALYHLRDLPHNVWNTDTLYVLTVDHPSTERLVDL